MTKLALNRPMNLRVAEWAAATIRLVCSPELEIPCQQVVNVALPSEVSSERAWWMSYARLAGCGNLREVLRDVSVKRRAGNVNAD